MLAVSLLKETKEKIFGLPQKSLFKTFFMKELIAHVRVLGLLMPLCFSAHSMDPFI